VEGDRGMEENIPTRLSPAEGRKFAFTVGAAFLVLGLIAWYRHHPVALAVLCGIGLTLCLAGLIAPGRLAPVLRLWMGLAHAISRVTTPIFMGIVYFLVFAPMGLVKRIAGHNALVRRAGKDGYWIRRNGQTGTRSNLERQF
jgi:hypothetical protein